MTLIFNENFAINPQSNQSGGGGGGGSQPSLKHTVVLEEEIKPMTVQIEVQEVS